jgi:hypothetical protein
MAHRWPKRRRRFSETTVGVMALSSWPWLALLGDGTECHDDA